MPRSHSPFFSVIIPTYNRLKFLIVALHSVLNQVCSDFEVIIIDDGSTDGSRSAVYAIADDRVRYFYQDNQGVAHARNQALKNVQGRYVAFLDSDDQWLPDKLRVAYQYIQKFPVFNIFHSNELWYRHGALLNQKSCHRNPEGRVYRQVVSKCCISISTAVIKQTLFNEVGVFDETLKTCEDYDFWLRAAHRYPVKLMSGALTVKDGGRPDQLSARWGMDRYRIRALEKMLNGGLLNKEEYDWTYQEFVKRISIFSAGAAKRGRMDEAESYQKLIEKYRH